MVVESAPDLPGLYELVVVDSTDSARMEAERLAAQGAEEGTLVWVKQQTHEVGRPGKAWIPGEHNLHCAIVLRPEDPFSICCQLSLLTSVCVGQAITVIGEPMEELRLGWPDDVYLNRGKIANVQLSGELGREGRLSWMVVSVNVNTFEHPASLGFAASSLQGEGFETFDRVAMLECFAREFLAWLNRWAEQGFQPIRKAWLWRGDWKEVEQSVDWDGRIYNGTFISLEDNGDLKLDTARGIIRIALDEFYRPEFRSVT